ncbi:peptide chain release factor H [Microbulbifer agarilyticus]|uniref:peptide chain release factor H n=1 Tax=Microbulbifer agarilyticus TaxID=260552 RepID=UPI001C96B1DB|nr:peptide chain release factor H [Microbulbifer agarilyticus]MBY6212307.1 peptide chain release factor H [Microbulbifer agarilyticus]
MMFLQLSAAQGPLECCLAVEHALKQVLAEAQQQGVEIQLVEQVSAKHGLKSATLAGDETAKPIFSSWLGTHLWVCPSPIRVGHKRKNWYFAGQLFTAKQLPKESEIDYSATRASGPGGQHVNKTSSAIRAIHHATGISVKVDTERSQHANKRLATALIAQKLEQIAAEQAAEQKAAMRRAHHQVERGGEVRVFIGEKFKESR